MQPFAEGMSQLVSHGRARPTIAAELWFPTWTWLIATGLLTQLQQWFPSLVVISWLPDTQYIWGPDMSELHCWKAFCLLLLLSK